ncbi:MAG: 50S ribosomal protein L17 [Spirochaetes bacterium]|nr:50S ribosomal protein L17 [Spirochaetota bacterium]
MKHRMGFNRLRRKASHRKALHRSMATALFKYERIRTTKAKAREIRRTAEKMITRAKVDNVHNRRIIFKNIKDSYILNKLFTEIAPRFIDRPGGYTRMLKLGFRFSDASEMVLLELVERKEIVRNRKKKEEAVEEAAPKES